MGVKHQLKQNSSGKMACYVNTLKQELSTAKTYEHKRSDETSIVDRHRVIWQLSVGCLLMRTIASFQRHTCYLNVINGPISRVLLLILVHVQLLSCLFYCSKFFTQIVGIPMDTKCAPLAADLFLFYYERDFMLSLSDNNQTDIIEAFNSTSRYLDDLLNIDNPYFEQMLGQIYATDLRLNKAKSSDTEDPFLDLNLSITNGKVSFKSYDKRDDFNFEIVNFPFLDGDVPRSPSYWRIYFSAYSFCKSVL